MWTLTVTNGYHTPIVTLGNTVAPGQTYQSPSNLGNANVSIPGLGDVVLLDIGDKQIGGFSKATWGVLLSFQGEEVVFRYEGGGQITVSINMLGQVELGGNGSFSAIPLPSFILPA